MEITLEIEARSGLDGLEMEIVKAEMDGKECAIGTTEIELLHVFMGVQRLSVTADLAVKP